MDRAISLDARRIDLTAEPRFRLGTVSVDPRSHEIAWNGGLRRVQPQTLKVLVALHDRRGEVVTREELVDRCWDGRFVGEDVINRCISLLRRVAADSGGFEIQTVPRAGYRLAQAQSARRQKPWWIASVAALPGSKGPRSSWVVGIAAGAVLLVAGGGLLAYQRLSRPTVHAVMLKPFDVAGNASLAHTFAAAVSADINSALSATGVDVLDPDSSGQSNARFVLSGRTEFTGADLHLTAELQDAEDHTLLWSTTYTRRATHAQAMQQQVAANLAAVLHCALDTSRQPDGEELGEDSIKLYLKACALQQSVDPPSDQIKGLLEQVTVREPRFAEGWARLAFFAANAVWPADPEEQVALRREARSAAQSALRLNPRSALAREALTEMELGHVPFAQIYREAQVNLSLDPNTDYLAGDGSELLLRMGRLNEGLERARRGVALDPLSPVQTSDLITALIDNARDAEAQSTLERALRVWPDDNMLRVSHLDYEARFGNPDKALAILDDPDERPERIRDVTLEAYRQLANVRKTNSSAQARRFVAWLKRQVALGQIGADFAAPHVAQFGDVDGAFQLAFAAPPDVINIDPEFLWEPESLALRRDPRFIALAAKFQVADFWSSTGLWPDFCSTPSWPYNCQEQAARASKAKA